MKRVALSAGALVAVAALLVASSSRAGGRPCIETSDIVGEQACTGYGHTWSVERKLPVVFRFGLRYSSFGTDDVTFRESFKAKHRPKGYRGFRYPGSELATSAVSGFGLDGGVSVFVWDQLYLGAEAAFSFGSMRSPSIMVGEHALSNASGVDVLLFHAGAPIGYRIPVGRVSFRGEVLFGGVLASVSQVQAKLPGLPTDVSATAGRFLIEPRGALDVWFTQHISLGAYAGVNALDTTGVAFGLTLAWHHRAFDGDMSIW